MYFKITVAATTIAATTATPTIVYKSRNMFFIRSR